MTKLLRRFDLAPGTRCDVVRHKDGKVRAQFYALHNNVYWRTCRTIDLTLRELEGIIKAVQEGHETK